MQLVISSRAGMLASSILGPDHSAVWLLLLGQLDQFTKSL